MIYFIRHGLDDENYIGGWSNVPLTNIGRKQIENSANWIKGNLNVKKLFLVIFYEQEKVSLLLEIY